MADKTTTVPMEEKEQKKSVKAMQRNRADLKKIRVLSIMLAFLHILTTVGLLMMCITSKSQTVIALTFCGLVSTLFAVHASYKTFSNTAETIANTDKPEELARQLPSWEWHNKYFINGIFVWFSMTFGSWPAIHIFLLQRRNEGSSIWGLVLNRLQAGIRNVLLTHMTATCLVCILALVGIVITTKTLRQVQKADEQANQDVGASMANVCNDDDFDDDDDSNPFPAKLKVLAGSVTFANVFFFVMLLTIAAEKANSAAVACCIVQIVSLCVILFYTKRVFKSKEEVDVENWILTWRVLMGISAFLSWSIGWTDGLYLIAFAHWKTDFWGLIGEVSSFERVWFILVFFLTLTIHLTYATSFFFHNRCMSTLDEIASLKLIEMMDEDVGSYSDDYDDDEGDYDDDDNDDSKG